MRAEREWIYYDPMFESDMYHPYLYRYAPWSGLRRFAYDFVRWYQPERIVELGSHYGCSTFAFLQAIRDGRQEEARRAMVRHISRSMENMLEHYAEE